MASISNLPVGSVDADVFTPPHHGPRISLFGVVVYLGAACFSLALGSWQLAALISLTPLLALLIGHRLQPWPLSPVWLPLGALTILGVGGTLLFGAGRRESDLPVIFNRHLVEPTVGIIFVSALALACGAIAYSTMRPRIATESLGQLLPPPRLRAVLLPAALAPLLVTVALTGDSLLVRPTYLQGTSGSLLAVVGSISLGAVVLLGAVAATDIGVRRGVALCGAAAYWVVLFASASRQFALAPVAFALSAYVCGRSRRAGRWVIATALFSLCLLQVPLYLRGLPEHGILPYWDALAAMPDLGAGLVYSLANVFSGFPVTGITAFASPPLDAHSLLVSLNPLPGRLTGWYEISPTLRIGTYYPYSALGEVANLGWSAVVLVWFSIGVVLAHLDRRVATFRATGYLVPALGIIALTVLFVLTATQYNMRTASRWLWYSLALDLGARWLWTRRSHASETQALATSTHASAAHD